MPVGVVCDRKIERELHSFLAFAGTLGEKISTDEPEAFTGAFTLALPEWIVRINGIKQAMRKELGLSDDSAQTTKALRVSTEG